SVPSEVLYLSSGSGEITLALEPESTEGFFFTGSEYLIRVEVDGNEVPHQIILAGEARAEVTASFSGLEDGRYRAAAVSTTGGGRDPGREALFIVDTEPPEIELIEPEGRELQPTQNAFVVRCRDAGAGVSPDPEESEFVAVINGRKVQGLATSEGDDLVFVIHTSNTWWDQWRTNQAVNLHVSVKDRAGNQGVLDIDFQVDAPRQERRFEIAECEDEDGDVTESSWYVTHRVPFPLTTSINWIRFDETVRDVSIFLGMGSRYTDTGLPLDRDLFYSLEDAVEIVADHPCLRVERLHPSPDNPGVNFRVSQVCLPEDHEPLGSITIKYPEAYVSDWDLKCPGSGSESLVTKLTPDGPMKSLSIPVFLHSEGGDYSDEIQVLDGRVIYRVALSGPSGLDTSTSWFEIGGARLWFSQKEQGVYEASMPVTREGLYVYATKLVLSGLRRAWGEDQEGEIGDNGRSLLWPGEVLVALDPPQIDHFHYDRENECFRATVSDQGTAPEDLVLELIAPGNVTPTIIFDPETGMVEAPYPMPTGIHAGLLEVTDLAGQTTTAACQVFGNTPSSQTVEDPHAEYPVTVKESSWSWPAKPPSGSSISGGVVTRHYTGEFRDGKEGVFECTTTTTFRCASSSCSRTLNRQYLNRQYLACVQIAEARFGQTSEPIAPPPLSSLVVDYSYSQELVKALEKCREKYAPIGGLGFTASSITSSTKTECRKLWLDTRPPRIRNLAFLPAERRITALIDDHGMPLSELHINYAVGADPHLSSSGVLRTESPTFTFDTKTGLLVGETSVRGDEPEIFNVYISATDAAGNRTSKRLEVTAPIRPPDVSVEILKRGPVAYPWGTCYDRSGIDHRKTEGWVDGRRVTLVGAHYGQRPSSDHVEFGPVTDEGPHMARLKVTDFAGLSSEASAAFEVSYPPKIENFRHLPTALQNAGGPAFSAFIHDSGNDLYLEGIDLVVDGKPIDRSRLFFDQRTGYFAADGPLDLSPGMHLARLTARDAHGNSDEAFLRFVPGERIHVHQEDRGGLSIDEVILWELQNHNGDGRANPGETVRLFVGLINNGYAGLTDVRGRLRSGEPGIVVEQDEVVFGDLERGRTLTPIHGFDIRINEDFLDRTFSDPYDARFTLEAIDGSGRAWTLDFNVPVYRPTIPFDVPRASPDSGDLPISEVIVNLNPLPPNTSEPTIEVSGTAVSTASIIDEVVIRVNGTPHTAVWNPMDGSLAVFVGLAVGDNLVEAQAVDRTGAVGSDMGFVHRSEPAIPPEIEINEPLQGGEYMSPQIYLRGDFSAGNSDISGFQVFMTANGETVSVPVGYSSPERTFWSGTNSSEEPLNEYFPFEDVGNTPETTVTVTVILTTTGGDVAQDSVTFTYACYY
ncbi:MAG: hypothetical protein ACQET7_15595, partial [Thermodesulfobacteriota bacterium]